MNSDGANSEPHPALPAGGQWYTHAPNTTVEIIMSPAVDVSSSTHSSLCFDFPVVSDAELSTLAETYVTMIQENDSTRLSAIPVRQRLLTNISEGVTSPSKSGYRNVLIAVSVYLPSYLCSTILRQVISHNRQSMKEPASNTDIPVPLEVASLLASLASDLHAVNDQEMTSPATEHDDCADDKPIPALVELPDQDNCSIRSDDSDAAEREWILAAQLQERIACEESDSTPLISESQVHHPIVRVTWADVASCLDYLTHFWTDAIISSPATDSTRWSPNVVANQMLDITQALQDIDILFCSASQSLPFQNDQSTLAGSQWDIQLDEVPVSDFDQESFDTFQIDSEATDLPTPPNAVATNEHCEIQHHPLFLSGSSIHSVILQRSRLLLCSHILAHPTTLPVFLPILLRRVFQVSTESASKASNFDSDINLILLLSQLWAVSWPKASCISSIFSDSLRRINNHTVSSIGDVAPLFCESQQQNHDSASISTLTSDCNRLISWLCSRFSLITKQLISKFKTRGDTQDDVNVKEIAALLHVLCTTAAVGDTTRVIQHALPLVLSCMSACAHFDGLHGQLLTSVNLLSQVLRRSALLMAACCPESVSQIWRSSPSLRANLKGDHACVADRVVWQLAVESQSKSELMDSPDVSWPKVLNIINSSISQNEPSTHAADSMLVFQCILFYCACRRNHCHVESRLFSDIRGSLTELHSKCTRQLALLVVPENGDANDANDSNGMQVSESLIAKKSIEAQRTRLIRMRTELKSLMISSARGNKAD